MHDGIDQLNAILYDDRGFQLRGERPALDMMSSTELHAWFDNVRNVLEGAYVAHSEPWRQSGMSGPEDRWVSLRKPVADCIERGGSFLDIGCANGYLLECCMKWTAERGIQIDPYGVDVSERLVDLARKRSPQFADHFFVANAFNWTPPMRFDYVRTELVYVPTELEREYVRRLLDGFVRPGGRLLIANYTEDHPNPTVGILPGASAISHILDHLAVLGFPVEGYRDGYDPVKSRRVRIAILNNGERHS